MIIDSIETIRELEEKLVSLEKEINNEKHIFFAKALLENKGNQTKSYMEVYPKAKNTTAIAQGSMIMTKPKVIEYYNLLKVIDERKKLQEKEGIVSFLVAKIQESSKTQEIQTKDGSRFAYMGEKVYATSVTKLIDILGIDAPKKIDETLKLDLKDEGDTDYADYLKWKNTRKLKKN